MISRAAATGPHYIATDINPHAMAAARRTFEANGLPVDLVHANLCAPFRLNKRVDVMLFNPPYVPTPTEEITSSWIARYGVCTCAYSVMRACAR